MKDYKYSYIIKLFGINFQFRCGRKLGLLQGFTFNVWWKTKRFRDTARKIKQMKDAHEKAGTSTLHFP